MSNHPSRFNPNRRSHRPSRNPSAANPSGTPSPRPAGPAVPPDGDRDRVTVEQIVRASEESERLTKLEAWSTMDLLDTIDPTLLQRADGTQRGLAADFAAQGRYDLVQAVADLGRFDRSRRIRAIVRMLIAGVPTQLIAVVLSVIAVMDVQREYDAACGLAADQRLTLADAEEMAAELEVDAQVRRMLSEADS